MMEPNNTQAPPPSYQAGPQQQPGQTYYQPPSSAPPGGYAPPPPTSNAQSMGVGQRFTQFYAPPKNRKLGLKRRIFTCVCCCILVGLIIGLAVGLTTTSSYYSCNCRSNADCQYQYGPGTYCYAGCQCARY